MMSPKKDLRLQGREAQHFTDLFDNLCDPNTVVNFEQRQKLLRGESTRIEEPAR